MSRNSPRSNRQREQERETVCCPHKPHEFLLVGQRKREVKAQPPSQYEQVNQEDDAKAKAAKSTGRVASPMRRGLLALPAPVLQAEGSAASSSAFAFLEPIARSTASSWACGERRLQLRQEFNAKELQAAKLIIKYDQNGNKLLEEDELELLLKDYNGGKKPKHEDIAYFLAVADSDHDGSISQTEILAGLSAWYALHNMPKSVGVAMGKQKIGGHAMPSTEQLQEFLGTLNENQPVSDEDVARVRYVAMALGATESKASIDHMRKAVAAWYIDVERGPSTQKQLHAQTMGGLWDRFMKDLMVFTGEFGHTATSRPARMMLYGLLFCGFGCPVTNLLISMWFPSNYSCEHPHLSGLLWWNAIFSIVLAVAGVLTCHTLTEKFLGCPMFFDASKTVVRSVFIVVLIVQVMIAIFGVTHVFSSSSMRCGFVIWYACQFTFVLQPMLILLGICIGLPVLYYEVYNDHAEIDQQLHDHDGTHELHNDGV